MGNSIDKDIKMKEDSPSDHESRMLPMLDVQMWVERNRIRYSFYEKLMVSMLVLMKRSALPTRTKIKILAQEVVRKRINTHQGEQRYCTCQDKRERERS